MSRINWLMTANEASILPALLRSRVRTIFVDPPSEAQLATFIEKEISRRSMPEDCVDQITKVIQGRTGNKAVSVRFVVKILEEVQRFEALPLKH